MVQQTTKPTAIFKGRIRPADRMLPGVPAEMILERPFAPVKKE